MVAGGWRVVSKRSWISGTVPDDVADGLFCINVLFPNGKKLAVNIAGDTEIDYEALEEQLDRVSGQFIWWAAVYSEAKAMAAILERRIKIRRAVLTSEALKSAREAGLVKVTNDQVAVIIDADETLNKWEVKLILLNRDVSKLFYMVKAIEMKSENLRSRSGFKKQEQNQQR